MRLQKYYNCIIDAKKLTSRNDEEELEWSKCITPLMLADDLKYIFVAHALRALCDDLIKAANSAITECE